MLQLHAIAPGFLLGVVTVAVLATEPTEPGTGATGEGPGGPAAIPASQRDLDTGLVQTTTTTFANIPNSVVTINNGTSTRNVVVTFSADAAVDDSGDVFLLGFRVDAGSCLEGTGPEFFTGSITIETRTAVHVISIGPGTHTIRPCWLVLSDGDGAQNISVAFRSLIAEGRTK